MAKNPMGKTRDVDNPYAIFRFKDFEIRVLKTYQLPKNEEKNMYARWFTAAKSPMTYGRWEYGDTYKREVLPFEQIASSPESDQAYGKDGKPVDLTPRPTHGSILA